jgi:hypothetical protein
LKHNQHQHHSQRFSTISKACRGSDGQL